MIATGNGRPAQQTDRPGKVGIPIPGETRVYLFISQGDITAPELAEALPLIALASIAVMQKRPIPGADQIYDMLSDGAKRHFVVREMSKIVVPV